ncbi:MAG TPA: PAS domain-containing protein [Metalysinibacillus sp.]
MNTSTFSPYIRIADAIYAIFKANCEVVIHDFSMMEKSLIYIKGDVTGRQLGAPVTDFVLQQIKKNPADLQDILGTYTTTADGKKIKSSIIFIKNEAGEAIGLFGINYNVTELADLQHILTDMLAPFEHTPPISESYAATVSEMFEQLVHATLVELNMTLPITTKEDKVKFVQALDNKGVFLVQGAMDKVSDILAVSKQTVYNYLES